MVKRIMLLGIGLMALFPFLTSVTHANLPYGIYGPQTSWDSKYYYWGSDMEPANSTNGIYISLDSTSVSYSSVKAVVTVDHQLIQERGIIGFEILANGIWVDNVDVYFDSTLTPPTYREYYPIDISVTDEFIGSYVNFQVLGVTRTGSDVYVVAWSAPSLTIQLKPFPVIDRDAIGILNLILQKLQDLKTALEGKLDQLKNAVESIYTVSPATQTKFDNALNNLQSKLPTEAFKNEFQSMQNLISDSSQRIQNAEAKLEFGEINWYGVTTTPAIDLTEVAEQVSGLRRILQISLWCEFFYAVILFLRPRLTV